MSSAPPFCPIRREYHNVVASLPRFGSLGTKPWYSQYHTLVCNLVSSNIDL